MAREIWRWVYINGEKAEYQISNQNGFRSYCRGGVKILGVHLDDQGYRQVFMYHNNRRYSKKYHRLIGQSFKKNPFNYKCINHKDGDKLNNKPSNLEYCTHSYNMKHAHDNGLLKVPSGENHYKARRVGAFLNGVLIFRFNAIKDAENDGFCNKKICRAAKTGIRHKGYNWNYLD